MPSSSARATAAAQRAGQGRAAGSRTQPQAAAAASESFSESFSRLWEGFTGGTPRPAPPAGKPAPTPVPSSSASTPRGFGDSLRSSWSDLLVATGLTPRGGMARADGAAGAPPGSAPQQLVTLRELEREVAELRARALAQEALLDGWSRFTRDVLFAALLARREENYREALGASLGARALDVDGIKSLDVVSVTLPTDVAHAPSLVLLKHEAAGVTRWTLDWRPPAKHCSAVVRVEGAAPFGRAFSVQCSVSEVRLSGTLRVAIDRRRGEKGELDISFVSLPTVDFKVAVVGSWMGEPLFKPCCLGGNIQSTIRGLLIWSLRSSTCLRQTAGEVQPPCPHALPPPPPAIRTVSVPARRFCRRAPVVPRTLRRRST